MKDKCLLEGSIAGDGTKRIRAQKEDKEREEKEKGRERGGEVSVLKGAAGSPPFQGANACWVFWFDTALQQQKRATSELNMEMEIFYCFSTMKRKQNIHGVQSNGSWMIEPNDIKRVFFDHFSCQFSEPSYSRAEFFSSKFKRLSVDQCLVIERPFCDEEIKTTFLECGEDKAPGLDGMTFKFVKHFWDTVGVDFINAVKHFGPSASLTKG
ncbi:hypothetical protein Tco_0901125 [Tanacetum coccineum]